MKYVIEHLDGRLYNWCLMEYTHISNIVGRQNVLFTNVKGKVAAEKLSKLGEVEKRSVTQLGLKDACILDPQAEDVLSTDDCSKFKYLIFGGVLGNYPMDGRTKTSITDRMECESRHLGSEQMATNTAVYVAKKIADGRRFSELEFLDTLEIKMSDCSSQEFPFRYVVEGGKPVLAPGFVEFLRKKRGF